MNDTQLVDVYLKTDVKMAALYSLSLSSFCVLAMTFGFLFMDFLLIEAVFFSLLFGLLCFSVLVFHFLNRSSARIQHSSGTILIESFRNKSISCIEINERDSFRRSFFGVRFYPHKKPEIYVFISRGDREIVMNLLTKWTPGKGQASS